MAVNKMSEVGFAEDEIRAFVQFGAAEIHAIGLYYKANAELENGLVDVEDNKVLQAQLDKCEQYRQDIETYANLRRRIMTHLYNLFEGDKDVWCLVKHLGIGAMQTMEAYQGSDNDLELLNLAYDANKAFTSAVTSFLGIEITDCAACLSDQLKGEHNE